MKTKPIIISCHSLSLLRISLNSKLRSTATKAGSPVAVLTVIFVLMLFSFQSPADAKTRLVDTSNAISVFDANEIEAIPITDRLLMLTPNIAQSSSTDNVQRGVDWAPAIRGLGNQIVTQYGSYLVNSATIRPDLTGGIWGLDPNIADLERVEIYSALQQPIYGRNSSYGVIVSRTDSLPSSVNVLKNYGSDRSSSFDLAYRLDDDFDFGTEGFKLGGPIVKDKLWFFGSFSLSDRQTSQSQSNPIQGGLFNSVDWQNVLDPIELKDIAKGINTSLTVDGFPFRFSDGYLAGPAFNEENYDLQSYANQAVVPNDPLYEEKSSDAVTSTLKKGIGTLFKLGSAVGVGVGSSDDEPAPSYQWGLPKVGFTPRSDAKSAWNVADGSQKNVIVAVIDSGLDLKHEDGPQYLWTNADEVPNNKKDDDGNGYVDDVHGWNFVGENNNLNDNYGHGTFVTGIIAAKTNNGEGIAGINPGAQVMVLKASNQEGRAGSLAIYRAIRYAVDNGARVINISLGSKDVSRLEQIAINYAYNQGCFVVVAAGNDGSHIAQYSPPGLRRAFAVGSLSVKGNRRQNSNYGPNVALVAPGEHIYSLTAKDGKKDGKITPRFHKGDYHTLSGTSFSAPFVTGTASLILAKYPDFSIREIEDMLLGTAADLGDQGWDRYYGSGLLNAGQALSAGRNSHLTVRPTEVFINKRHNKISSLDVYGIIRGPLASYVVEIGNGKEPKKWQKACGPLKAPVEYKLICRVEDEVLKKGEDWTVRIVASSSAGKKKEARIIVNK